MKLSICSVVLMALIIIGVILVGKSVYNQHKNIVEKFEGHKYDLSLTNILQTKINKLKKNISK